MICVSVDDDGFISQLPSDYWLEGAKTRCLLACMVHQSNKEIAANFSSPLSGQSREIQHSNATARVAKEWEDEREAQTRTRSMDDKRTNR
jgi:hypothetical protein